MDTNETRTCVVVALKTVLRDAQELYFSGILKYTETDICASAENGTWVFAINTADITNVELRCRTSDLPDGDLGWYAITLCISTISFGKAVEAFTYLIEMFDE